MLAISIALVFIKFSGVQIQELIFLGINFGTLENPQAIYVGIWILYFYFLVRYYQYYMQEGRAKLQDAINAIIEPKLQRIAMNICSQTSEDATYEPGNLLSMRHAKWVLKITYKHHYDVSGESQRSVKRVAITRPQLIGSYGGSILYVILNRSEATDFVLPFLVAALAFGYCFAGAESGLLEVIGVLSGT